MKNQHEILPRSQNARLIGQIDDFKVKNSCLRIEPMHKQKQFYTISPEADVN